ncbi:DUF6879 family protein [Streptomyces lydicus]|uniref:DUF6879 domain-containing protein n=1 Tax=Streptomyces lydicus TaxID=47763 RepID=A0A1D7VTB4_9ACTN|nr:DUF6879 family protein [Streptomyces lydicus]AOP49999.1 hypothetical protein SL103_30460 [Streptomyces lydicus]
MISASNDLAARFSTFQEEAFRLETLDDYSNSGNPAAFRAFLAGEPKPADYNAGWLETVRTATESGKRMVRVHVLSRPLTPYLRYELSWGYQTNMMAGEEFHILDTTDRPNPLEGVPDFWLFDGREPVVLNYDENGAFTGPTFVPAPGALPTGEQSEYATYRSVALAMSVPFTEWWGKHGAA